jgi:hypothetical protein
MAKLADNGKKDINEENNRKKENPNQYETYCKEDCCSKEGKSREGQEDGYKEKERSQKAVMLRSPLNWVDSGV